MVGDIFVGPLFSLPQAWKGGQGEKSFPSVLPLACISQQGRCLRNSWVGDLPHGDGPYQLHLLAGVLWPGFNSFLQVGPESVNALLGARRPCCSTQITKPSSALGSWRSCDTLTEEGGPGLAGWSNTRLHSYTLTLWDSLFKLKPEQLWAPRPGSQMQTVQFIQWLKPNWNAISIPKMCRICRAMKIL